MRKHVLKADDKFPNINNYTVICTVETSYWKTASNNTISWVQNPTNKIHLSRSSKMSGRRKFNKDHNSERLFCNGVPVRSRRFAALYVFSSLFKEKKWLITFKNGQYPTLHLNRDVAKEKLRRLIFSLATAIQFLLNSTFKIVPCLCLLI